VECPNTGILFAARVYLFGLFYGPKVTIIKWKGAE